MESVPGAPAARKAGELANGQVNNFLDSVEDLTNALKDIESPEIARMRAKVKLALVAAKSAASDAASQIRGQAEQVSRRTDTFVRDNPWQVIGFAPGLGLLLGILPALPSFARPPPPLSGPPPPPASPTPPARLQPPRT